MDDFDWYRIFKMIHIFGVAMLAAGIGIETVVGPLMQKASSVQEVRAYTRAGKVAENFLNIPAFVLIVVFGYLTADKLNVDLDVTWLLIGQIVAYAAFAVAFGYLRGAMLKANKAAEAAPDGPLSDELRAMVNDPKPAALGGALLLAFVFLIYVMTVKPNW